MNDVAWVFSTCVSILKEGRERVNWVLLEEFEI